MASNYTFTPQTTFGPQGQFAEYSNLALGFLVVILTSLTISSAQHRKRTKGLPYPPGPQGWPFVGNLWQFPSKFQWRVFTEWGKKYGPIMHVKVYGTHILILNDAKITIDLLEGKSGIYSDRPGFVMGGKIIGWDKSVVSIPYGTIHREYRRVMHTGLSPKAILGYRDLLQDECHILLRGLIEEPKNFRARIRRYIGSTILQITYGYKPETNDDPYISAIEQAVENFTSASIPGAYKVDTIPWLRHIPSWLPGMGWKRQGLIWRVQRDEALEAPMKFVRDDLSAGDGPHSFTSRILDNYGGLNASKKDERFCIEAAGTLYGAGTEPTVAGIANFFMAMCLFPEVQAKAQAEVDRVLGDSHRLPTLEDKDSGAFPYVDALVKEIFRWRPLVPLGLPHALREDDVYEGKYFIPKGTMILTNIWAMHRDVRYFPRPNEVIPERYLPRDQRDGRGVDLPELGDPGDSFAREFGSYLFGFGRRSCGGAHLADASFWLAVATILASFTVTCAKDEHGNDIIPDDMNATSAFLSHPYQFPCTITPRPDAPPIPS